MRTHFLIRPLLPALIAILLLSCGAGDEAGDQANDTGDTVDNTDDSSDGANSPQVIDDTLLIDDEGRITGTDIPQCNTDEECDDGLFCNGVEQCRPGFPDTDALGCRSGEAPTGFDPNPTDCTVLGSCDEDTDSFPLITLSEGDSCTDGIACSENDSCQTDGSCVGIPSDPLCDDGMFCNGQESCSTIIGCMAGTPPIGTDPTDEDCLVAGPCEEATDSFALIPAEIGVTCNDGLSCTTEDSCTGAGTCEGTPDHTACSDGEFCNGVEQCVVNTGCQPANGPASPPEDQNPDDCFVPTVCNEETDSFDEIPVPAGTICNDGLDCTTGDTCNDTHVCIGESDNSTCDDGLFCNGVEICDSSNGCTTGSPPSPPTDEKPNDCFVYGPCSESLGGFAYDILLSAGTDCEDGLSCTQNDKCGSQGVCTGIPDDSECEDDLFCNGSEVCDATNGCISGAPPTAPEDSDLDDCYEPTCDETTKSFVDGPLLTGTECNDGVECSLNDVCNETAVCAGVPEDSKCGDGNFCNGNESCDPSNGCQPGQPPNPEMENSNPCLIFYCDETNDIISWTKASVGSECNDGIFCTVEDQCDGAGECAGTPNNEPCDDGKFCNGSEVCTIGIGCEAGPSPNPKDKNLDDCKQPVCNEELDAIENVNVPDNTVCNDGSSVTVNDVCIAGVCSGTPP